jgi:hypothetical protein
VHALTRALPWSGVWPSRVAFGRPKMSVWGHAGARSAPAKVACISFTRSLFWYLFDVSVSSFLFQTPLHQNSLQTLNGHSQLRTRWRFTVP